MDSLRQAEWNKSHRFMLWLIRCLSYLLSEWMLFTRETKIKLLPCSAETFISCCHTDTSWLMAVWMEALPAFFLFLSHMEYLSASAEHSPSGSRRCYPGWENWCRKWMLSGTWCGFQKEGSISNNALRTGIHPANPSVPDTLLVFCLVLVSWQLIGNQNTHTHMISLYS